jgi:hypothetical protein
MTDRTQRDGLEVTITSGELAELDAAASELRAAITRLTQLGLLRAETWAAMSLANVEERRDEIRAWEAG